MLNSKRLWRTLLYVLLTAALCGSFAFPLTEVSVKAAPQMQAASCVGTPFVGWTFENVVTPSTGTGAFNVGPGLPAPTFASGSSGQAVSFSNWTTSTSLDANYFVEFVASTSGKSTINLNFDYRATGTGPQFLQIQYSTDGGANFVPFGSPIPVMRDSTFHPLSFDFASVPMLNDNAKSVFRVYGYAATGASGTLRLDNAVFCGVPILTIDSIVPNPTSAGTTVTWHALENGNYDVRIGATSCTDGTSVASGSYSTSPNPVPISVDGAALAAGANSVFVCLTDAASNVHSATSSVTKDTTVPTVTVNKASGQADTTTSLPINFSVVFSEPIDASSFTVTDITQSGSATGITWTIIDSGDHMNFTLRATAVTGPGTLVPSIAANSVTDLVGNNNTASTGTATVTYSATVPLSVIINEVAWSGTAANPDDEWIELYNPGSVEVDITGWQLYGDDNILNKVGSPNITLSGKIPAGEYFLLERNEQATTAASKQVYSTGDLLNTGERLYLKDNSGTTIDTANIDGGAWPAGTASSGTPLYASMERIGTSNAWITYGGTVPIANDRNGGPIKGTPGATNWISSTTITTITSDLPDPSVTNANVTVAVSVIGGKTTPTGTVNITGANTNCSITLNSTGTGSCVVKFSSVGSKVITATYLGDASHPASTDTEAHQVTTSGSSLPTPVATPKPPPELVAINEFVPRPGHDWNQDGVVNVGDEYIELLNHGTVNVNLSGYSLDDEVNVGSAPFHLPAVTIRPGERIVYYGSVTGLLLGDGGDAVRLTKPNGQLMDAYNYTVVGYPDQSFCRLPDNGGADDWSTSCFPTPGLQNSLSGVSPASENNPNTDLYCPIADTLPDDFVQAECQPFGNDIWRPEFWDKTGWYGEMPLPGIDAKWPVIAN